MTDRLWMVLAYRYYCGNDAHRIRDMWVLNQVIKRIYVIIGELLGYKMHLGYGIVSRLNCWVECLLTRTGHFVNLQYGWVRPRAKQFIWVGKGSDFLRSWTAVRQWDCLQALSPSQTSSSHILVSQKTTRCCQSLGFPGGILLLNHVMVAWKYAHGLAFDSRMALPSAQIFLSSETHKLPGVQLIGIMKLSFLLDLAQDASRPYLK